MTTTYIAVTHDLRDEDGQRLAFDYLLLDGAQHPETLHAYLQGCTGLAWQSVFDKTEAEETGAAGLFLARLPAGGHPASAIFELLDRSEPCLIKLRSPLDLPELAQHLRAYLYADLGDNISALVRYFDPRNLGAALQTWHAPTARCFLAPLLQLQYRGHHEEWQTQPGLNLPQPEFALPGEIAFDQAQIDQLLAHCEPDHLLGILCENGQIATGTPYLPRYRNFLPRYQRAQGWGLSDATEILQYCVFSYRYGFSFDATPAIAEQLITLHRQQGNIDGFADRIPCEVWEQLDAALTNAAEAS
ncbi:protein of unknown function [Andreprevotia lacus DSM 23236]|jgi:hypothetical protein|uniref:DUF4123 domain-containing protein n=1 Tax=Andreprevotia lacus DSM 23236 TaxID=1121001 RepID=A0A1W1Y1E9_9NEIS|nr:DUF4123 domain-containing protein [Andreprevotia lacus]SMC29955.1 protein of unknown function [Andreprevotia lacus DSM 23236]